MHQVTNEMQKVNIKGILDFRGFFPGGGKPFPERAVDSWLSVTVSRTVKSLSFRTSGISNHRSCHISSSKTKEPETTHIRIMADFIV
jgi:hypothetical protein